jgi:DNA-binding CsgD family transcriptional regulator
LGSAPHRARLHQRAGEAIELVHRAELDQHLAELAHHFIQAGRGGDVAKAVAYAGRAGERALRQLAYEDAVHHYRRALDALALKSGEAHDLGRERGELLLALGTAQTQAGQLDDAARTFREVAALARALRLPDQLARAAIGFAGTTESAVTDQVVNGTLLAEALAALDESDSPLRATVLSRLAWALMTTGPQARAAEVSRQALAMARRLGDAHTLVNALYGRLAALLGPAHAEERLAVGSELGQLGERTGDLGRAARGHSYRTFALIELGDVDEAERASADYRRVGDELRLPLYRYAALLRPATFALLRGRFAEGERLLHEARAGLESIGYPVAAQYFVAGMLMAWADRDPHHSTLEAEVAGLPDHPFGVRFMASARAWMQAETGQPAARGLVDELAADDFGWLGHDQRNWLPSAALCAAACAALGDMARAAILFELLRPYAARNVTMHMGVGCYGAAARYLGLLAATLERWDDADRYFEQAVALNGRMGARPWVARTRYDHALALLARAAQTRPGEQLRPRALELLRRAGADAEELGLGRLAERCRAAPAPLPGGLTAREAEVLALLAAGATNKEIADRLVISAYTVERHISNLYAKIGARGRADATAFALRHGLQGSR